jgi:hypothetical protein
MDPRKQLAAAIMERSTVIGMPSDCPTGTLEKLLLREKITELHVDRTTFVPIEQAGLHAEPS